jgi:hypothetical protein
VAKSHQLQIRVTERQKAELKRHAQRAGLDMSTYVLARALPASRSRVAEVIGRLSGGEGQRFALAELNDLLTGLAAGEFTDAVSDVDLRGLSPFLQNYVAAMVEQAAHLKAVRPPAWAQDIEPLELPYFAVPFGRLRPHLLRSSPVAFKRRNLFVDATIGDRV